MILLRGGPSEADFERLSYAFRNVREKIRTGELKHDLENIWPEFGDVFWSPKTMQGFVVTKPHGYAGDFEIIDRIYTNWISPYGEHLAKWDYYFHSQPAVQAVRNRKKYFLELIETLCSQRGNDLKVLNIGSGPARDIYECLSQGKNELFFDCVDQDEKAIAYAKLLNRDYLNKIIFHQCNAFKFSSSKRFDLVWSAGLFDYLSDRAFKTLLKRLLKVVIPHGCLVVGNFSHENTSRDYMELGHWFLEHRSENDLIDLAVACGIKKDNISIGKESQGVNLFLHITNE